jgi:uncharacterized membrane-anchored protein YhcB (DUF1043 family)
VYAVGWLIVWVLLALAGGVAIGVAVTRAKTHRTADRVRELEDQLAGARRELDDYRAEVVTQFGATARKFQSLNEAYTDLHLQLARSSSILCGASSGPLLAAPPGHQDLIAPDPAQGEPPLTLAEDPDGSAAAADDITADPVAADPDPATAETAETAEMTAEAIAEPAGEPPDRTAEPRPEPETASAEENTRR